MLPLNKLLRIALPLGTATTAALITTILLSINRDDLDKKKESEDKELEDFVDPVKDLEEKKILEPQDQKEEQEPSEKGDKPENPFDDKGSGSPSEEQRESVEAPKIELDKLNEVVEKTVLEGVSSLGQIGQKGQGGVPKSDKEKAGSSIDSKDPLSEVSDSDSNNNSLNSSEEPAKGTGAKAEEDNVIGDSIQQEIALKENVSLQPESTSNDDGREMEASQSDLENEKIELAEDSESSLDPSGVQATSVLESDNPEGLTAEDSSGGREDDGVEKASGEKDTPPLDGEKGRQGVDGQGLSTRAKDSLGSDEKEVNKDGINGGNSDQFSEKAIKELEGYEVELSFLEDKLSNLV